MLWELENEEGWGLNGCDWFKTPLQVIDEAENGIQISSIWTRNSMMSFFLKPPRMLNTLNGFWGHLLYTSQIEEQRKIYMPTINYILGG